MATRYWVGGAGNWSSTTKWSTTSGGSSGASVPISTDDVVFDANSGGKFTATVDTAQTCASLTITPSAGVGVFQLAITASLTVAGNFTTSGTAGNNRIWIRGTTYGVRTNLVCNGTVSISDCDFRDIIVTGTAAPISGTRIGNRGACTGITFDAPKTVYWNLSGTQNWSADAWAANSGGTRNTNNFPLPQDTAVFNNAGTAGTVTLDSAIAYIPTVNMSSRTTAMTLSFSSATTCYGSFSFGSGVTSSNFQTLTFSGEGTKTITSAGKTSTRPITIDAYGGTVELADALNIGTTTLTVTNGTFDTKNFNVTAASLSSSNSNIRSIKLGSSTLTLTSGIVFTTTTNLTFDAGTSSINITYPGGGNAIAGSGLTFYNVSVGTSNNPTQHTIQGPNTFNSLEFRDPGSTGYVNYTITGDLTIGTLTSTGTSVSSRVFISSDIVGVRRVLTASTMSMSDCDFRGITIAGAAAGTSVTRGGDCEQNSGITFPAPKTVYRVGTDTTWVGSNSWALTSGGTGANNNLPLAQDVAVIDDSTALTGTLTLGSNTEFNIGSIDFSARTTGITLSYDTNSIFTLHKDFILSSAVTISGSSGAMWFSGPNNQTLETAGKSLPFGIVVDKSSGELQLASALTATTGFTLRTGTFNAVSYNVTIPICTLDIVNNARTLKMGSGQWTLTGTGTLWDASGSAGLTLLKGTADILLSNTSTSARRFDGGNLSYNKLTIGGTTGTSTLTVSGDNTFTELASTKTVAHTIALGSSTQTFGKWSVTGTAGNVVTLTGTGTSHVLAGSATSSIDYLAMGSIGFAATSPAEFYAGANSTGTRGAPVFRTATPAARTLYWVGGTGNWSDTARWSLSSGGTGGEATPTSLDNVVFDSASNATAYTATINTITGGNRCNALTINGPASGNVTLAGATNLICHDNVTLPSSGLSRTYTGQLVLSGSTPGKTITTNGNALYQGVNINGMGSEWSLGSAFSVTSIGGVILTAGSFNTNNYNVTVSGMFGGSSSTRSMYLGSSTVNITNGSLDFETAINITFDAGTSELLCASGGFGGDGFTFYNVTLNENNVNGSNTFNNLTISSNSDNGAKSVSFDADQTINGTLTINAGVAAAKRNFIRSNALGTTRTLTCASFSSATDCDFRDIAIAGAVAPISGTRLGDCGGNSGITFPAPKTVYWRLTTGGSWYDTAWSTSPIGIAGANNFPLPQDTAVFSARPSFGSSISINESCNIGTINMSSRTISSTMTLNISSSPTIYGNWINGTGTTLSNTTTITFAGRGSQTITSAGRSFSQTVRFSSVGGSVTLQDAFVSTRTSSAAVFFDSGTFDANSYNVTIGGLSSNVTTTRTLGVGSGTWILNDSGILWNINATNLTVTGTGTIGVASTSLGKTFAGGGANYSGITINQGGTGILTITGNNTFADITNTATGATTIALGTTTQRVGAFTAKGTAGKVLTLTGNTSNLVYTGEGSITGLNYLDIQGRAFGPTGQITDVWYAGANSINSGSFGWTYEGALALTAGNFLFLLL